MARESMNSLEQEPESAWVDSISSKPTNELATTIGLVSGSPTSIDGQVLERLIAQVVRSLSSARDSQRLLVVRLDVFRSQDLERAADQPRSIPVALRSPLGPWSEVTIPMPVGSRVLVPGTASGMAGHVEASV